MAKIAFIGVGNMGAPMACNLIAAGHELTVYDVVTESIKAVKGARGTASATEAVKDAELVISMLPESRHVESLYLFDDQLLEHIDARALIIDCSTIAPSTSKKVAAAAQAKGIAMIDAPVSGGTNGALAGTLTFMVGGQAAALERARPVLEVMGKNIFHAGDSGSGQVAKIANNMMLGIAMAGTCEALALGVANGMDPAVLSEIMRKSSGGSWTLEKYNPWPGVMEGVPAALEYAGGFGVDLMLKDLGLATTAAVDSRANITLGATARNLFSLHSNNGNGKLDFSSILKMIAP
jgi:3-hydroxyisobutyrate dehydrogenase